MFIGCVLLKYTGNPRLLALCYHVYLFEVRCTIPRIFMMEHFLPGISQLFLGHSIKVMFQERHSNLKAEHILKQLDQNQNPLRGYWNPVVWFLMTTIEQFKYKYN